MIADELVRHRIEWCEMARREFRGHAEISAELPVDDDASPQAK
jgi:hypothetical protein